MPLNQVTILEKVKSPFKVLKSRFTTNDKTFTASKGWYECFWITDGWHNTNVLGEAASAN
jgi:hypothetical protein